jgi:hypothetical protein
VGRNGDRSRAAQRRKGTLSSGRGKAAPSLPKPESVISEKTFTSPKGTRYRILTTTEMDPYDPPLQGKTKRKDNPRFTKRQ